MAIGQLPEPDVEGSEEAIFAEINITPLTDIFLVLLIIFMVASSTVVQKAKEEQQRIAEDREAQERMGLKVNLPSGASQEIDVSKPSLVVTITQDGAVVVNKESVDQGDMEKLFRAAYARDKDTQVVLKADKGVPHGRVVGVMELAKGVGLTRLAIGTAGGG